MSRQDYCTNTNEKGNCNCQPCDSTNALLDRPDLANELTNFLGQSLLIVLSANQLNIQNQVFRPIMCGNVVEVTNQYVELDHVNIKMSNAPEYVFPTQLIIPLINVSWFMPFDCSVRFSLY